MSHPDLALGIDIGTGTTKAVLADVRGQILWQASSSYQYDVPRAQWVEQNPLDWWSALCRCTRSLFAAYPDARGRIAAVAVSGQGVGAVAIDRGGAVLRPAILWLDQRSAADAAELQERHGDQIVRISGKLPGSYNFEPKVRWIQHNEPDIWARTWKVLTPTAFITFCLSGRAVMNHSDGGILLGYDLAGRSWSHELLALLNLPMHVYCDLAECTEVIGTVTPQAEGESGIPAGVPVVGGGEDTSSAGLAMGVFTPDTGQLSLGTASTVYVPAAKTTVHSQLLAFPHVLPEVNLIGGSMSSGGLSIQWIRKILGTDATSEDLDLLNNASQLAPGTSGLIFLPYLAGELQPINDGFARGVFFGLTAEMGRAHLFRAVLEGLAFAIQHNLSIARTAGAAPRQLLAVGGPSRNALLCQIIADVTGISVHVMDENGGAALGSALLAAAGAGLGSLPAMQKAHARLRASYSPDGSHAPLYQEAFALYLDLYRQVKDLYPRAAVLTSTHSARSMDVPVH